jgi:hypothetical protein
MYSAKKDCSLAILLVSVPQRKYTPSTVLYTRTTKRMTGLLLDKKKT